MELHERLVTNKQTAAAPPTREPFADLKNSIHMLVNSELGPQLTGQIIDPGGLRDRVLADIRRHLANETGISRDDRERQIALTGRIGAALDRLARKPLLGGIVAAMEAPARKAGLRALHDFLARGLAAFRHMRGAAEFLAIVATRERELNERIYASATAALGRQPGDLGRTD